MSCITLVCLTVSLSDCLCSEMQGLNPFPDVTLQIDCLIAADYTETVFNDSRADNRLYDIYLIDSQYLGRAVESGLIVNVNG